MKFPHISKRWRTILPFLASLLFLYVSHGLWLPFFGKFLVVDDDLKKSDVIIVLAAHSKGARVDWAVKLYKKDLAKKIIMSGCQVGWKTSLAEIMKKQALHLGVPEDAIILDYGWNNGGTWDQAINALKIVKENDFRSAIVVTSNYHTRRAILAFYKVFKNTGLKILISPCLRGSLVSGQWWKSREHIETVFLEYVKLFYYFLFPPRLNLQ